MSVKPNPTRGSVLVSQGGQFSLSLDTCPQPRTTSFNVVAVFQPRICLRRVPLEVGALASMGPRFLTRGFTSAMPFFVSSPKPQWGRGFSTADLTSPVRRFVGFHVLQWGRGFSTADLGHTKLETLSIYLLQWGRDFSTADLSAAPRRSRSRTTFNGAAISQPRIFADRAVVDPDICLQWGRDFSTADLIRIVRIDAHITHLQWGRDFSTADLHPTIEEPAEQVAPSMRPRFLNRGSDQGALAALLYQILQWGRGFSTADLRPAARPVIDLNPSMGPRFLNRGSAAAGLWLEHLACLQWAAISQPRIWRRP